MVKLLSGLCVCVLFAASASAATITINTTGVVGAFGWDVFRFGITTAENEASGAARLLSMGPSEFRSHNTAPCIVHGPITECYQTSSTDYTGSITGGTQVYGSADVTGYNYVLGFYSNPDPNPPIWEVDAHWYDGWVLFHVPTFGNTLPQTALQEWTNQNGYQSTLTRYTYLHDAPTATASVPDASSSLILLALSMSSFIGLRRRLA